MKPNKQVIIDDLIKFVKQGKSFDTCLALSVTKWNLTRSTFIRRWNHANKQHTEAQQVIKKELQAVDMQSAKEAAINGLKSKFERLMFLQHQANQCLKELEANIEYDYPVIAGKVQKVSRPMTVSERSKLRQVFKELQAEISKIEGDYEKDNKQKAPLLFPFIDEQSAKNISDALDRSV